MTEVERPACGFGGRAGGGGRGGGELKGGDAPRGNGGGGCDFDRGMGG